MSVDWSSSLDLLLDVDRPFKGAPRRRALESALRTAIRDGRLTVGTAVPSSRSLAHDLGMARGTVTEAYRQLAAEGYLTSRQGAPTRVSWTPPRAAPPPAVQAGGAPPRWDFRPGRPDRTSFPRTAWGRAYRQVLAQAPDEAFDYGAAPGRAELRLALAGYLGRARGVDTSPDRLLITGGFTESLTLICHTLKARGARRLALEDPCGPRYPVLVRTVGLEVVPVACDEEGLRVTDLARTGADAVLVTPAHQYPLGVTMSAARRTALVSWARRAGALIIEDDYDGEFRYDRQPVGALQQLDPGRVVYLGTASKSLAPAVRLGWISPPRSFAADLVPVKDHLEHGPCVLNQLALARLITDGGFDQHIRRMRARYRRRRDELAQALATRLPALGLAGTAAGLHAVIYLNRSGPGDGPGEEDLLRRAARRSLGLSTLSQYWHGPPDRSAPPRPQAMIAGYATPPGHAYRPAVQALIDLLASRP